jgi:phosphopantetheinyl transferase
MLLFCSAVVLISFLLVNDNDICKVLDILDTLTHFSFFPLPHLKDRKSPSELFDMKRKRKRRLLRRAKENYLTIEKLKRETFSIRVRRAKLSMAFFCFGTSNTLNESPIQFNISHSSPIALLALDECKL